MGTRSSRPSEQSSRTVATQTQSSRGLVLKVEILNGNTLDFYELFDLERYTPWSPGFVQEVGSRYRRQSLIYHPDKNSPEHKGECDVIMAGLTLAKDTLTNKTHKHRYDSELREVRGERTYWDTFRWVTKRCFNAVALLGGGVAVAAGLFGAVPSGGASLALTVGGAAAVSAGIGGTSSVYHDPHAPMRTYAQDVAMGAGRGLLTHVGVHTESVDPRTRFPPQPAQLTGRAPAQPTGTSAQLTGSSVGGDRGSCPRSSQDTPGVYRITASVCEVKAGPSQCSDVLEELHCGDFVYVKEVRTVSVEQRWGALDLRFHVARGRILSGWISLQATNDRGQSLCTWARKV